MTKKEYLDAFRKRIESGKAVESLYKEAVKQKSYFNDYAKILLENDVRNYLGNIESNEERENSYKVENHNGVTNLGDSNGKSFRWEERECLALYNYFSGSKHDSDIRIIDYQMPLKNTNSDNEKGVDLIGTDGTNIFLLEYKRFNSKESLLRSAVEVYTYKRLLDKGQERVCSDYGCPAGKLIPSILIMEKSEQDKSYNYNKEKDAPIIQLLRELEISVFIIRPSVDFAENKIMKNLLAKNKPEFDFDLCVKDVTLWKKY